MKFLLDYLNANADSITVFGLILSAFFTIITL